MPSWNRVMSALPTVLDDIHEAVNQDMKDYQ